MGGTRRVGWVGAVAVAASLGLGIGPAAAEPTPLVYAAGPLTDLAPASVNVTDGASAELFAVPNAEGTYVILFLWGLDPAAEGQTYGAHVHVGPCVEGNGSAAGPHYNSGGTPSPETEVWLDFEVLPLGFGVATAQVPFTIEPGAAQSVVVHAQPTEADGSSPGAAGARMACLPVEF